MSMEDHAIVVVNGTKIPLIGIPPDATIEECDLCHVHHPIQDIQMSEAGQMLCPKCRKAGSSNEHRTTQ